MKTPQQSYDSLANALDVPELYLKREDLHKFGSHKGRSIPLMIKHYLKQEGQTNFVISSSGNAALAAAQAVGQHNKNNPESQILLTIYVGHRIPEAKLAKLQSLTTEKIILEQVEKPKQTAFYQDKIGEAKNLRQSTDDLALEGYAELAQELLSIPNLQAIFIPTSSGTAAQGIAKIFEAQEQSPQVHIVQTSACHPMVDSIRHEQSESTETSLAGAIVDKIAHRKVAVTEAVQNSGGTGWSATDEDITQAINTVKAHADLDISPNSALSVAGLMLATKEGWEFDGPVACLITGE